jgi:hypothetical protein
MKGSQEMKVDWEKVADQMGIKYKRNSKTPGFFVTGNGVKKKIGAAELFKDWTPTE